MASVHLGAALGHLQRLFGEGTLAGSSDAQLLKRYVSERDELAFEALVQRHGPMVMSACRGILADPNDVDDAFQASFLLLARKAGSLRTSAALAAWLHRVACRVAFQVKSDAARRRDRERRAVEAVGALRSLPTAPWDDRHAILHEEIDRLPERYRRPIVLCYLEEMTYKEAASQLRWSEGSTQGRLRRGKDLLKARLTRRGVTLAGAGLSALIVPKTTTAVSAALLQATVRAARHFVLGKAAAVGTVSATTSTLVNRALRSMILAELKIAGAAAVVLAALTSIGFVAFGAGRPDHARPVQAPAHAQVTKAKVPPAVGADAPVRGAPAAPVEVRGQVVGPDGTPVAGATVSAARFDDVDVRANPETTSGQDGRFLLRLSRLARNSVMLNGQDIFPWVVASATGFGPGKVEGAYKAAALGELTIRLVEDGPPIEGRVVNLEGRPVAGAQIQAKRLFFAGEGDLTAWLAQAKDRGIRSPGDGLNELPTKIATTTDLDGRFQVTGLGRERIVELLISAPTIAATQVYAMNRDGADFRAADRQSMKAVPLVIHGRRFEHAVAPTKPIEGVIRDKDTGRPIAGMTVHGAVYDPQSLVWAPGIEATSDAEGHYRLSGLPKAPAYRLFIVQAEGKPYPRATFRAPGQSPAFEPVNFDIALKRGVLIRGRITNKATGEPVPGYVNAFTFRNNPAIESFPGYVLNDIAYVFIKDDGRFEVIGLPGRNIIACRSEMRRYRGHVGAEKIAGYDPKQMALYDTLPLSCFFRNYHVLSEIDVDTKLETATLDLQVDPGRSVTLKAVDPEGKPIGGTKASGVSDLFSSSMEYEQASPTIEIHGLDPSNPRRVIVTHAGRRLIGSIYLKGDEGGPLTIKLLPWGAISGRAIDNDRNPRGGLSLGSAGGSYPERPDMQGVLPETDYGGIRIGSDGRFRVERLVPGLQYGATATERGMGIGELFHDVIVAPGEVKDLGDLKVKS